MLSIVQGGNARHKHSEKLFGWKSLFLSTRNYFVNGVMKKYKVFFAGLDRLLSFLSTFILYLFENRRKKRLSGMEVRVGVSLLFTWWWCKKFNISHNTSLYGFQVISCEGMYHICYSIFHKIRIYASKQEGGKNIYALFFRYISLS